MAGDFDGFDWNAFNDKLFSRLDIAAEYTDMGLRIVPGATPNSKGWLDCHAIDRDDKKPSAGINVSGNGSRGLYNDFGRTDGKAMNMWTFAVTYCGSRFRTKMDAIRYFAKKAGVDDDLPKAKSRNDGPIEDQLRFCGEGILKCFDYLAGRVVKMYPGISREALRLCGSSIAMYPKWKSCPQQVFTLPCFGPDILKPTGYVLMPIWDKGVDLGPNREAPKRITIGDSGLVGEWGLRHLKEAKFVIKPEGITDMLSIQNLLGNSTETVVITNSCGANESTLPAKVAHLFTGKKVLVLHDGDKAGQLGAQLWLGALGKHASDVANLKPDDGCDARSVIVKMMKGRIK